MIGAKKFNRFSGWVGNAEGYRNSTGSFNPRQQVSCGLLVLHAERKGANIEGQSRVNLFRYFLLIGSVLLLASCHRGPVAAGSAPQTSVEQRVADLEHQLDGNAPRPSDEALAKEADHDLAEIRSLGLIDRAVRDFGNRQPGAVIQACRVAYFMDTNTVWCNISYKVPGKDAPAEDSFGYKRQTGTNWLLIANDGQRP